MGGWPSRDALVDAATETVVLVCAACINSDVTICAFKTNLTRTVICVDRVYALSAVCTRI